MALIGTVRPYSSTDPALIAPTAAAGPLYFMGVLRTVHTCNCASSPHARGHPSNEAHHAVRADSAPSCCRIDHPCIDIWCEYCTCVPFDEGSARESLMAPTVVLSCSGTCRPPGGLRVASITQRLTGRAVWVGRRRACPDSRPPFFCCVKGPSAPWMSRCTSRGLLQMHTVRVSKTGGGVRASASGRLSDILWTKQLCTDRYVEALYSRSCKASPKSVVVSCLADSRCEYACALDDSRPGQGPWGPRNPRFFNCVSHLQFLLLSDILWWKNRLGAALCDGVLTFLVRRKDPYLEAA